MNFFFVFLGGGIGATARYWMSGTIAKWAGPGFPYGTLAVNALGCVLIGFLMTAFEERFIVIPSLRIFLTIGILGGFTTFSTFSFETISMLQAGEFYRAFGNIGLSLCMCLGGTYLGMVAGKIF